VDISLHPSSLSENTNQIEDEKKLNHVVLYWLKKPGDRENIEKIIAMAKKLSINPLSFECSGGKSGIE